MFRVFDKKEKKFLRDCFIDSEGKVYQKDGFLDTLMEIKNCIVDFNLKVMDMQLKSVYEGDIILCNGSKYIARRDTFGVAVESKTQSRMPINQLTHRFEIIGNIHQNHELLND